jgi:starch phosphorylase
MWQDLWPGLPVDQVPIASITNGVHVPTWTAGEIDRLQKSHVAEDWIERHDDPALWERVSAIPDEALWEVRRTLKAGLFHFLRDRVRHRWAASHADPGQAVSFGSLLDPAALTIGFARRVATYKRLELLTRDPERTLALLGGERSVQVVLAGKAHPRDEEAKQTLQRFFGLKWAEVVGERVVFLDDYDLATGAALVRGCDVWLNVPRPPLEASGTSGMKAAINGGLQVSVLDGWWAEGYDGENGWALPGDVEDDPEAQDARDADALHRVLGEEVVPAFYDRNEQGLPDAWLARMRASLKTNGPRFSASRMLAEYVAGPYRRPEG